jgi:hypothetical protein
MAAPRGASRTCNDFGYCTQTANMLPFGILVLTLGNLLWRLACERAILFFSIHGRLLWIERNTGVGTLFRRGYQRDVEGESLGV